MTKIRGKYFKISKSFFLAPSKPILRGSKAYLSFLLGGVFLFFLASCQLRDQKRSENLTQLYFAQSIDASRILTADPKEAYFERVGKVDIGIQLDTCLPETLTSTDAVELLKATLAQDVLPFSEAEINKLRAQLGIIRQWCQDLNPALLPDTLNLLKVGGRHYGEGTFYTRGKTIVIPSQALERPNLQALRKTLLHEIFHIYSRFHPAQKNALYELIGFKKQAGKVVWPKSIQEKLLLNPDGLDYRHAIRLKENDSLAIPVLLSNEPCFKKEKSGYFAYAGLKLIPVRVDQKQDVLRVSPDTVLNYLDYPSFFEQITDNTSYVIHPDEILADNFALLLLSKYDPDPRNEVTFSGEGAILLREMETIISASGIK